ncbi:MAG: Glu-tRNA(Gln) amidotransferase subunit GatD [Candidatus Bathyarchaeia archaeon]
MKTEKEASGYKGQVLNTLEKLDVNVGDTIRVTRGKNVYEGVLIPRSEYSDDQHVVIKLKNGYNIGVLINSETKIEKIGKGAKPAFTAQPVPEQKGKLPKVAILSTGGTIASRVDYRTGAVRPALTASDLYSVVPELADMAQVETEILFSLFSENIAPQHWTTIANAVARQIEKGADGVVVAHGTDTLGYTAAALSFALQNLPVPVILVGSQRSADRPSSDAATNLIGAVTAAVKAPFAEVAVAFHETPSDTVISVYRGTKVRKCHTSRRDAFKSVNAPPMAKIQNSQVLMLTEEFRKRKSENKLVLKAVFDDKVALVKFHPAMNPEIIDFYVGKGYKGIVFEGTGLGHVSETLHPQIANAVKNGVVVAMASQCVWGRVNMNVYDSGRDLLALGVVPLEDMLAETALVKLMWVFGQTQNIEEAKKLLTTNLVGEISPRTLLDETETNTEETLG